jgi:hypothetical protein
LYDRNKDNRILVFDQAENGEPEPDGDTTWKYKRQFNVAKLLSTDNCTWSMGISPLDGTMVMASRQYQMVQIWYPGIRKRSSFLADCCTIQ